MLTCLPQGFALPLVQPDSHRHHHRYAAHLPDHDSHPPLRRRLQPNRARLRGDQADQSEPQGLPRDLPRRER
jgi:hypothetical protein